MLMISGLNYLVQKKSVVEIDQAFLQQGELVGLLGPNGAGKSTLLKLLCCELKAEYGEITLHGTPLKNWPRLLLACHLAVLPQSSQMMFPFTAEEVVSLGLTPLKIKQNDGRLLVRKKMQQTDCEQLKNKNFMQLSGGEKQRVQLARVLVQLEQAERAPLLLLDEPTSAQDIRQQHAVLSLAQCLASEKGYGILSVLHDMNHALRYADKVWLIKEGKVVVEGLPEDCLDKNNIKNIWNYRAQIIQTENGQRIIC